MNGEYFIQKVQWRGLRAGDPTTARQLTGDSYPPEAREILKEEGPKYQYAKGCLSDGILGSWIARGCSLGGIIDPQMEESHLLSVYRNNLKRDLSSHTNPQRPNYAMGKEAGLLLCSWPNGGEPSLPFPYSNEVWTGIEYQVASHLMMTGHVREGLEIVRATRDRYDGKTCNPYNEYECGHWYARAMSSYALLQGLTGAKYDALEHILTIAPNIAGDFCSFLATNSGYGTIGVKNGKPFCYVVSGTIPYKQIDYTAFKETTS